MCEPMSITAGVMGGMSLLQGGMAAKDQAKQVGAAIDQQNKTKAELIKQMNISNANSDLEVKQKLQDSFVQSSDINLQGVHNEGIMRAAIGESMLSGHSMDRMMADVIGEEARAQTQNSENYERDYQNAYLDKLTNYENTKAQITGMPSINRPSRLATGISTFGGAATSAFGAYMGAKGAEDTTTSGKVLGGIKGGLGMGGLK